MPPMDATSKVKSGVEQKAKTSKTKLINNFKKLNDEMLSIISPLQMAAMIVKRETISRLVNLFVNPRIMIASKTFMQAYINKTPNKTLTHERIGEKSEMTSKTTFAV